MGDLVAIALPGGPAFVDAVRTAWDKGDAVAPLDPRAPDPHRRSVLAALAPTLLVDAAGTHRLEGRAVQEGDAVVVATSGTTGEPKGAVLTFEAVRHAAAITSAAAGADADSCWLACLPLWHVGGFSVIARALHTGAGLVLHDGVDPAAIDRAAAEGATHVSLVATVLARVHAERWQRILLGGAAAPPELPANCTATYGMTETFGGIVWDGRALPGVDVRIAGADADATSGPIEVRSPTLLRTYRDGSEPLDKDGWFRTGDIGHLSADGRLVVEGRADHVIVTGGEKVWPEAVEAVLETHPGVADAAVIGRDDAEWGRRVVALVVPADPAAPPELAELRAFVKQHMPAPAAPRELELVPTLPRTSLGKLSRRTLGAE